MKITAAQYARSLYESTDGKSQREIDGAIANLVKLLRRNNQVKMLKNIIASFNDIWNRQQGIVEAEVVGREKLDKDVLTRVSTYVSNRYKAEKVVLAEKVDEKIKGGIIIRVGDEVLDASVSKNLVDLRKILTS